MANEATDFGRLEGAHNAQTSTIGSMPVSARSCSGMSLRKLDKIAPHTKITGRGHRRVNDLCASVDDVHPEVMSMLECVAAEASASGRRHSGGYRKGEVDCCS
jgi:hypothetical protein